MNKWPSVLTAVAFASGPASAGAPPFAAAPVADVELAAITGGFSTPVGIDVNFAVEINTRIDGQLALRSVLKPGIDPVTVYVPPVTPPVVSVPPVNVTPVTVPPVNVTPVEVGPVNVAPVDVPPVAVPSISIPPINIGSSPAPTTPSSPPAPMNQALPSPVLDTALNTPSVQQVLPAINVTVGAIGSAAGDIAAAVSPEQLVVPTTGAGAAPIESAFGNVTVEPSRTGPQVLLAGPDIEVRHMLGQATTVIANVANERVIDTTTIVHLDLPNVQGLALGSALSRIDDAIRRD